MGKGRQNPKILTPQQEEFLKNYLDPQSETWSDAYNSAIKAKYSIEYAESIRNQGVKWIDEAIQDSDLLQKALKNLKDFLGDKETKNIQWDASKFVLERLGKKKFSTKGEDATEKLAEKITGMRIIDASNIQKRKSETDTGG